MEKINRQRAPKGTVTIRKKGNSYEARVTLALNSIMEGVDKNPRLSRTARSEKEARKRLGELITDVYFDIKRNSKIPNVKVFTEECSSELNKFTEFNEEKAKRKIEILADDYTLFPNIAKEWLNWKKNQVNPTTNKTISLKTVETYINTIKNHVMVDFEKYHVSEISKDLVENYINEKRQKTPRLAKDLFLLIRAVLTYAKDKKGLIKEVPNFDLKFQKKKRAKVTKGCYLPEERQKVWLDVCEQDKRPFALLFATLLQTGMRPEEGCGLKWKSVHFNQNKIKVENAYKDITLYDDEMNITGHIMTDGDLKTTESYRNIPMTQRLKEMLLNLKREKMNNLQYGQEWDNNEYVFLNTIGTPYVPERLTKKIAEFIKKHKLEHMTIYGFRHSFATLMSEKGMDKEVLRELMGHAEFETTDFYYIHVSEERKKKEFERVNFEEFQGKTKNSESKPTQVKRYFLKKKPQKKKRVLKLA